MKSPRRDLIGVFLRHRTAANLLMVFLIVIGLFSLGQLNTQFFPKFTIDWITVSVDWPGASAEDIDANIIGVIEPKVRFLNNVYRGASSSSEGGGLVGVVGQRPGEVPGGLIDILPAQRINDRVDREIERLEFLTIEIHLDFASHRAPQPHPTNAGQLLQLGNDFDLGTPGRLDRRESAFETEVDDRRIAFVVAAKERAIDFVRQLLSNLLHRLPHVIDRDIQIGSPRHADPNVADSLGTVTREFLGPLDRAEHLLERPCQQRLDFLGCRSPVKRLDAHRGQPQHVLQSVGKRGVPRIPRELD